MHEQIQNFFIFEKNKFERKPDKKSRYLVFLFVVDLLFVLEVFASELALAVRLSASSSLTSPPIPAISAPAPTAPVIAPVTAPTAAPLKTSLMTPVALPTMPFDDLTTFF